MPPHFSAIKINGVRLYKFARRDIFISLRPRPVYIKEIVLLSKNENIIEINIKCSRGTYIRALARDIAHKIGTYAYLDKLTRMSIGTFNESKCMNINNIIKCLSL